jgi:hypothetical protein
MTDHINEKIGDSLKRFGRDAVDSLTSNGRQRVQGRRDVGDRVKMLYADWNRFAGQHDLDAKRPTVKDFLDFFWHSYGVDASEVVERVIGERKPETKPFSPHERYANFDFGAPPADRQDAADPTEPKEPAEPKDQADSNEPAGAAAETRKFHDGLMTTILNNFKAGAADPKKFNKAQAATMIRVLWKQSHKADPEEKKRVNYFFTLLKKHGPYKTLLPGIKDIPTNESLHYEHKPLMEAQNKFDMVLTPDEIRTIFMGLVRLHMRNPQEFARVTRAGQQGSPVRGNASNPPQQRSASGNAEAARQPGINSKFVLDKHLLRSHLAAMHIRMADFDKFHRMLVDENPEEALHMIGREIPIDQAKRILAAIMQSMKPV